VIKAFEYLDSIYFDDVKGLSRAPVTSVVNLIFAVDVQVRLLALYGLQ
jgi:hypothetical protein